MNPRQWPFPDLFQPSSSGPGSHFVGVEPVIIVPPAGSPVYIYNMASCVFIQQIGCLQCINMQALHAESLMDLTTVGYFSLGFQQHCHVKLIITCHMYFSLGFQHHCHVKLIIVCHMNKKFSWYDSTDRHVMLVVLTINNIVHLGQLHKHDNYNGDETVTAQTPHCILTEIIFNYMIKDDINFISNEVFILAYIRQVYVARKSRNIIYWKAQF